MADEKKAPAKAAKTGKPSGWKRFINWWAKLPARIAAAFRNMWLELKKVSWPTKRKLLVYSGVVLVLLLFLTVVIGLIDMGASALVRLLV